MSRFPDLPLLLGVAGLLAILPAAAEKPGHYGYGSPATEEQIAGWDIDVRPDGAGLPPGQGSVEDGEWLYEEQCAQCHGSFGESVGGYPALAGGGGSLTDARPHKTVGSYWAYASTLWDYIHRAMPYTQPESLSDDEVYAITAYVLHLNDIVDYEFVLTRDNLPAVAMANAGSFTADPRPDTDNPRCMKNCKVPGQIAITSEAPAYVPDEAAEVPYGATEAADAIIEAADEASIAAGLALARDRNKGNCFACHRVAGADMAGDGGPPLERMAIRFPDRDGLKAQIADPRVRNPNTVMPPYGAHGILTERELELVVDYIYSL